METIIEFFNGSGTTLLIVFLSSILPLLLGIGLTFLARTHKITDSVLGLLSIPFESLCPPVVLLTVFYVPGLLFGFPVRDRLPVAIIALSLCFIAYMPARHVAEYSVLKNLLYNGLGLISTVAKWSFIARSIAVADLLMVAERHTAEGNLWPLLITLLATSLLVGVLELGRWLVKTLMKSKKPTSAEPLEH